MGILDSANEEHFANLMASSDNQSECYRVAFKSKAKPESIHQMASRLMSSVKVKARISELKKEIASIGLWDRADSLRVLSEIAKGDDLEAKTGDKINAVKAINQMNGWDKQTIDHTSSDGSMSPKEPKTLNDFYEANT